MPRDEPPEMAGWNLALRFVLELVALAGIAAIAWTLADGVLRWVAAAVAVVASATAWGTFNVAGDPSRSGRAPVAVSGRQRLVVEGVVLAAGVIGLGLVAPWLAALDLCAVVVHYVVGRARVGWLLDAS